MIMKYFNLIPRVPFPHPSPPGRVGGGRVEENPRNKAVIFICQKRGTILYIWTNLTNDDLSLNKNFLTTSTSTVNREKRDF